MRLCFTLIILLCSIFLETKSKTFLVEIGDEKSESGGDYKCSTDCQSRFKYTKKEKESSPLEGISWVDGKIGDLINLASHGISGQVYLSKDLTKIGIKNFTYDGIQAKAIFLFGKEGYGPYGDGLKTAVVIPYPFKGKYYKRSDTDFPILGAFNGEDILLPLPEGTNFDDYKWISVLCNTSAINMAQVNLYKAGQGYLDRGFPPNHYEGKSPDTDKMIGYFTNLASHGIFGEVYVDKTETKITIKDFTYDGTAKGIFLLGRDGYAPYGDGLKTALVIPYPFKGKYYERSDTDFPFLDKFDYEDVQFPLPKDTKIDDYKWISVFCNASGYNLAQVNIVDPRTYLKN